MTKAQRTVMVSLRLAMGWLMLYAGWVKIVDPQWSAAGYLLNAKTFPSFFSWFAQPEILPVVNLLNEWALFLLGLSLILGIAVRFSSILGALLMLLYYFPVLDFPHIPPYAFLVDDHIIYALVLFMFAVFRAGRTVGVDGHVRLASRAWYQRFVG